MINSILWPTFALVALVFVVWAVLIVGRYRHMQKTPPSAADFADRAAATRYFAPVEAPGANLANLFELPVLYFALVPLLMLTRHADHLQVGLAWAYVALRAVHSLIHLGPNRVMARFSAYLASCLVLAAMWIIFAVGLASSAAAYGASL